MSVVVRRDWGIRLVSNPLFLLSLEESHCLEEAQWFWVTEWGGGQWFQCDMCKLCLGASPDQSLIDVAQELSPQCQAVPLHQEASLHLPSWWQGHQKGIRSQGRVRLFPFFLLSFLFSLIPLLSYLAYLM